ncbi:MAG: hypothetical protein HZC55_21120 [Verrucomicrobia bacterium]|nr:hypothetical protein [Verrucomicrobiota bacterium]
MSFLAKSPQLPASTAQDAAQFSTYREADPVPIGFGRDFFASRWLCEPYDWRTAPGGQRGQEWQYCSIAAMYRDGPIDFVGKVKRDGKVIANLDYTFGVGEESHEFTLNPSLALGQAWKMIVHRGTETAAASAALIAGTGQAHPPYRGRAWIEWINIDLGQGVTALPDLQVELGRKTPAVGGYAAGDSHPYGVNPFAAIYALLTDESGFGVGADYLDAGHWGAQATALEATGIADRSGAWVHCHPVFKSAQEASALLSTILAHVDGYLYAEAGKFRVGWFPSQAPAGGLPEITEHDLEAAPSGAEFPDWNRSAGSTVVVFRDFARDYNDTPALCPAPANRETGVVANPARVERPQIHAADQAAAIAAEISASRGSSEATVSLKVQKSRAVKGDGTPLQPGDLFQWDYEPHGLDLVMRVVGRRIRAGETADLIEAVPERGQFPLPYVPPVDARVLPTPSAPGEIAVGDVRLWLLPAGFTNLRKVAPLVNRAHRGIYRADLHLSTAGAAPWSIILDARAFVAKCTVTNGGVSGVAAVVRITTTSVDFARFVAQNAVSQADDTLCLLLDQEVCSVGAITAVAANTYDLAILRGRRGTAAAAHADGGAAWLFYRDELPAVEHAEFYRVRDGGNAYHVPTATKYFKLQLFTIDQDGLAKPDDPGLALQLPDLSADESAGYTILLTNEAHTVACASDGTVNAGQLGVGSTARTDVKVFRGSAQLTPVVAGPNSDQFSVSLAAVTNCTGTKEDNDSVRCDTLSADSGTIEIAVNVAGAFTVAKVFTLTKAKAGTAGAPGVAGIPGPGLVYVGPYNAGQVYHHTNSRRDVVSSGGSYYLANNPAKSGTATWGAPGGGDWSAPDATYKFVATALLLAEDATILRTLVMGDGVTANAGLIRSAAATGFATGAGFWLGYDGTTPKFRIGDPAGAHLAWDGANLTVKGGNANYLVEQGYDAGTVNAYWRLYRGGALKVEIQSYGTDGVGDGAYINITGTGGRSAYLGVNGGPGGKPGLELSLDTNLYRAAANKLKTDDALEIALTLAVAGESTFNGHVNLANGVDAKVGGDIYLGLAGTNRWIYDCDGNRILQKRHASTPSTLAEVIDVLQHHGLCN